MLLLHINRLKHRIRVGKKGTLREHTEGLNCDVLQAYLKEETGQNSKPRKDNQTFS
jgi:hypothetical protein